MSALGGVEQTFLIHSPMSANDPKRTLRALLAIARLNLLAKTGDAFAKGGSMRFRQGSNFERLNSIGRFRRPPLDRCE
jgi:hypothetical protein